MNIHKCPRILLFCFFLAILASPDHIFAADEVEPNDSTVTATFLASGSAMSGSISPVGDVDFFAFSGPNSTWGFIALLDTSGSSESDAATLSALDYYGMTIQSDTGSWELGSGIALQSFVSGQGTYYLKVNEDGGDGLVTPYSLCYYETITLTQPEVEPNDTPATGTPSGFTHAGAIDPAGDVDCFSFQGRAGDTILIAVNGDPEGDGTATDVVLELLDPAGTVLKTADVSLGGGSEFIKYSGLAEDGVYCYRISGKFGNGGPTATYHAGIVRNSGLYYPSYTHGMDWIDKPVDGIIKIGQPMTLELYVQNTSPVTIPGEIILYANYDDACLNLVQTSPEATFIDGGNVSWAGQKTGLAPGETYTVSLILRASSVCAGDVQQSLVVDYYFTGSGNQVSYTIVRSIFMPAIPLLLGE